MNQAERAELEAVAAKAASWLLGRQATGKAFLPAVRSSFCPVALTAMALWALSESRATAMSASQALGAVEFLASYRQDDGGLYDPERGLATYTSGVAAKALRSLKDRHAAQEIGRILPALELFVYRQDAPESWTDLRDKTGTARLQVTAEAKALLAKGSGLSREEARALEFLARCRAEATARRPLRTRVPGWRGSRQELESFDYDELLPFVYRPLESNYPIAIRAYCAIQRHYTIERNPDLTQRYGEQGFVPGTQGLYYYYLTLARTLSTFKTPWLKVSGKETRDWVRELTGKLLGLQRQDGSWVNTDGQWLEDEPALVTSYVLLALSMCRDVRTYPTVKE